MHPWRTVGRAIPRSGCSPAEPASVSPGGRDDTAKGQCGARPKVKDREGLGGTLIVAGGQAVGTSNCRRWGGILVADQGREGRGHSAFAVASGNTPSPPPWAAGMKVD